MLKGYAHKLTADDLPRILEIYETRQSNLKVKISPTIDQYFRKGFDIACQNKLGHSIWGYKNKDDKLVMFATRSFWSGMPYSTVGNLFIDGNDSFFGPSIDGIITTNYFLNDIFVDATINHGRHVHYMARDYHNTVTVLKVAHKLSTEQRNMLFDCNLVEIIAPYNRAKYEFGSNILGILEGRNPQPIVIRSFTLKPELNPEITCIKNHEFLVN